MENVKQVLANRRSDFFFSPLNYAPADPRSGIKPKDLNFTMATDPES